MSADADPGLAPFIRGVKAGGLDDAVHAVLRDGDPYTLCGMWAASRNCVPADDYADLGAECWSCAIEAEALALPQGGEHG